MTDNNVYAPTGFQIMAFGQIIQTFARTETLWAAMVAKLINCTMDHSFVLMSGLSFRAKKNAVTSLIHHVSISATQKERIIWFVSQVAKHSRLRNSIAHHVWVTGTRPKSIKPSYFDIMGGKGEIIGDDDEEVDYTDEDLEIAADELSTLYNDFLAYLLSENLIDPPDKTAFTSSTTS
ncbi:MAG: hypothetical protein ACLPL5_07670 [Stellaceae bacterium]